MISSRQRSGFTLVEILISLGILGVIMVSTFNFIDSSVAVSNSTNSSNELVREGQIGQQVIAARFKEACFVFPSATVMSLSGSGFTSKNFFTTSFQWTVNTDPFVAMILPPAPGQPNNLFRLMAYYAVPRNQWVNQATGINNPGIDVKNDGSTWLIVQYLKEFTSAATVPCSAKNAETGFATAITAGDTSILLDYVDIPANRNELFQVNTNSIDYDIRLEKTSAGGNVVRVGGAGSESSLRGRVFPTNLGL